MTTKQTGTTEATHTATPWTLSRSFVGRDTSALKTTTVVAGTTVVAECNKRPVQEAEANARFIVRACNAHDALVAACRGLLASYATSTDYKANMLPRDGRRCLHCHSQWDRETPEAHAGRCPVPKAVAALAAACPE